MSFRRRHGLPIADPRNLGQYLPPPTREEAPEAYRTDEETAIVMAESNAVFDRLIAQTRAELAGQPAAAEESPEQSEAPSSDEEVDDDETGDYVPGRVQPSGSGAGPSTGVVEQVSDDDNGEVVEEEDEDDDADEDDEDDADDAAAPADALGVNDGNWQVGVPKSLAYYVASDANGGMRLKKITYAVDFDSKADVNKANKTRRLEVWRANKRYDLDDQLKRPSMKGREFTEENRVMISILHEDYAISNNGRRIPGWQLKDWYDEEFPDEDRSVASLTTYVKRNAGLRAMSESYPL